MRWILFATTILLLAGCIDSPGSPVQADDTAQHESGVRAQATASEDRWLRDGAQRHAVRMTADHDDNALPEIELLSFETYGQDALLTFNASDPEDDALGWGVDITSDGVVEVRGISWPAAVVLRNVSEGFQVATVLVEDGHHLASIELGYQTMGSTDPMQFSDYILDACLPVGKDATCAFGSTADHFIAIREHAPALEANLTWDLFGLDLDLRLFTLDGARLAESTTSECPIGAGLGCDAPSERIRMELEPGIYRLEVQGYQAADAEYHLEIKTAAERSELRSDGASG